MAGSNRYLERVCCAVLLLDSGQVYLPYRSDDDDVRITVSRAAGVGLAITIVAVLYLGILQIRRIRGQSKRHRILCNFDVLFGRYY